MVVDPGQSIQPDRDLAFEQATSGLQSTPVLGAAVLAFVVVAVGRLIRRLLERLSTAQKTS